MQQTAIAIQDLPLMAGAATSTRDALAGAATVRRYAAGQLVLLEGDPCTEVQLIGKGLLRARHTNPDGREQVVAYLGPGRVLNLVPGLDEGPAMATVDALTDTTAYALPCETLRHWLARDAGLAFSLARFLAGEIRRLDTMLADLALRPVRARLARFLLTHAESNPAHHRWTQASIAANIGTVRDVVGRLLRDMRQEGIIRRERGRLVIVDRDALEREAEAA